MKSKTFILIAALLLSLQVSASFTNGAKATAKLSITIAKKAALLGIQAIKLPVKIFFLPAKIIGKTVTFTIGTGMVIGTIIIGEHLYKSQQIKASNHEEISDQAHGNIFQYLLDILDIRRTYLHQFGSHSR